MDAKICCSNCQDKCEISDDSKESYSGPGTNPCYFFFFQAEDGIRDTSVIGVQTCALPIFVFVVAPAAAVVLHRIESQRETLRHDGHVEIEGGAQAVVGARLQRDGPDVAIEDRAIRRDEIGRASCRERV